MPTRFGVICEPREENKGNLMSWLSGTAHLLLASSHRHWFSLTPCFSGVLSASRTTVNPFKGFNGVHTRLPETSKSCKKKSPLCDVTGDGCSSEQTSNWRRTPPALKDGPQKNKNHENSHKT